MEEKWGLSPGGKMEKKKGGRDNGWCNRGREVLGGGRCEKFRGNWHNTT